MILRDIGNVDAADAVLLDPDLGVGQATQDRARRLGRRPAEVAPGAVKNRLPKLRLVLDWIWLPVSADGAKGAVLVVATGGASRRGTLRR